jgi:hypothetical protein
MIFAYANRKVFIMKVIVSLFLVAATTVALWGAVCIVDFTVHMVCFFQ